MKTILAIAILALSSCAEMPLTLSVQGEHGVYSYSAKRGVEITVHATK